MSAKVIVLPDEVQKALGENAPKQLVSTINEIAGTHSASKVDKAEDDAHAQVIKAQFEVYEQKMETFRMDIEKKFQVLRAEIKVSIKGALLAGLAWTTVLIGGLFRALHAVVK